MRPIGPSLWAPGIPARKNVSEQEAGPLEDPWGLVSTPFLTLVVLRSDAWVCLPCARRTHEGPEPHPRPCHPPRCLREEEARGRTLEGPD